MNVSTTVDASTNILRLALTVTHLTLVCVGTINLLVIAIILAKPYMRSITNVYMIGLCLADFMYLANLTLVAAAQLNNKSWMFGSVMCIIYHGTETTGKYASVIFVVLLAADRYCAMCCPDLCIRYRNYRTAMTASAVAWCLALLAAIPLYIFAEVAELRFRSISIARRVCIAKWPSSSSARMYITFSSILIYALPLVLMAYFNYHILKKLREALQGSRRLKRESKSRAPYHRVTRLVLWVVIFHATCWSPFWLFNLLTSVFRLRIHTRFDRVIINVIHLFPYINCALNPIIYATHAANFRDAFRSLFCGDRPNRRVPVKKRSTLPADNRQLLRHTMDPSLAVSPFLRRMPFVRNRYVRCNKRSHSVLRDGYMGPKNSESKDYDYENKISPHDYRDFTAIIISKSDSQDAATKVQKYSKRFSSNSQHAMGNDITNSIQQTNNKDDKGTSVQTCRPSTVLFDTCSTTLTTGITVCDGDSML